MKIYKLYKFIYYLYLAPLHDPHFVGFSNIKAVILEVLTNGLYFTG
jgi:hypothetical protein